MILNAKLRENGERRDSGMERDVHREHYPSWPYPMYNDVVEDRFRDRRGREHYDNGRYAPMHSESRGTLTWDTNEKERHAERSSVDREKPSSNYPYQIGYNWDGYVEPYSDMDDVESRRRYRRDSRGRFRSDMGDKDVDMHYPVRYPFPPPVYEDPEIDKHSPRLIGFSGHDGGFKNDLFMIRGGAAYKDLKLDEEMAHDWMKSLQNEDGTTGPHWTREQANQVIKQKNLNCDPLEFWVALNGVYSDYFGVAKKFNVNNIDFYVAMAKAFIEDKDSQPNRLARYYEYISKH